jgi:hypothetical protein
VDFEVQFSIWPIFQILFFKSWLKKAVKISQILVFLTLGSFEIAGFLAYSSESFFPDGSSKGDFGKNDFF